MEVLVVGSIAFDSIETPGGEVHDKLGGSASYFSAAARYFSEPRVVAVVGEDFPRKHLDWFRDLGAETEGIDIEPGKTFRWSGRYGEDPNDRETLYTHLNVFETFHPVIPENWVDSRVVFLANIDPDLQREVLEQVRDPQLVVADTMNLWIETRRKSLNELIGRVHVLVINDSEIMELTGKTDILHAAEEILARGPVAVVVKEGRHGATLVGRNKLFTIPAYPLRNVVDPTGAGDSFAGGFVSLLSFTGLGGEMAWNNAVVYGNIIASFCCENFGPDRLSTLTRKELFGRLEEFERIISFDLSGLESSRTADPRRDRDLLEGM